MSRSLPDTLLRPWRNALVLFCGLAVAVDGLTADEPQAPAADAKADETKKPKESEIDPFAAPETNDVGELLKYVRKLERWQPEVDRTRLKDAEYVKSKREEFQRSRATLLAAVERAEALKPEQEEVRQALTKTKFGVLQMLSNLGDETAEKKLNELVDELIKAGSGPLFGMANRIKLRNRVDSFFAGQSNDTLESIIADLDKLIAEKATMVDGLTMSGTLAYMSSMRGNYELAKQLNAKILKNAEQIEDERIRKSLSRGAEQSLQQLGLIGQPVELKAVKLDGSEFDLASLRGKVVLIDFWATWCGPCIAEHPNVVANYEKYHDQGFEVVGVSIDEDQAKLQEFVDKHKTAWTTIFNPDEETRGFDDPLARRFFVNGIPATYLVDKQGNLIHINVRGKRLGELLEQLLAK